MQFLFTDGCNQDFITLCWLLDDYLNEIAGGEKNRAQYIPYNTLEDIHDVVIAYENNNPIGCASFKFFETDTAEVKRVFIKKEYRGKGISEQLMRLLENRAIEKGFTKLVLESGEPLVEAMGLYRKIGYSIIENYGPYKNLSDSICMQKVLKAACI
ncbi:MAG: GCN5-related N-acetyltransferase [Firmicutes bacterium]|nr:GCN5-related N-acetyltransferase [Bacillota bacterium]